MAEQKGFGFEVFTQNGYRLDEVASALQKSIRRGKEEEALQWALELYPKYHKYLWGRLMVVSAEDIEEYQAGVIVNALHDMFVKTNEGGKQIRHRIFITKTILYLCRAVKSRESDHFQHYHDKVQKQRGDVLSEIPEYAKDVHTKAGRLAGKTKAQFMVEEQEGLEPKGRDDYYEKLIAK